MTGLRKVCVTAVAAAMFMAPAAMTTASAAATAQAREPGCAKLRGYGAGWADIYNECNHVISASVEVDGWDPDCIQIGALRTERIGLEPGDVPYYAYDEC
ncbi:hypothetical protein [Streptomyces sp. A012304]|uniref:hypothetical protein n=1 Tax=Streptomyces sp. A012304 TaxID=375446 RepID=UPI00223266CB|nr:hypothetical protein [Streptomyces sp. A012304]GKQ36345.1 hypothetical protein ALMP_28880 [Streptomyces sp. A012304]